MNELSDRNKSTYKLKNIGPIYYLNLDGQPERREYMESQFKYWEIKNYTRISAYDGREDDLSDILTGRYPDMMTSGEIGCTTSHLKAIKHWMETSDSPYAIMMEDDCSMDLVRFWNFTWDDFYAHIPYDWDVVQIAIICTGDIHVKLHKRFVNDFSTACYLINRNHAEKLLKFHSRGDKYKLDNGCKPRIQFLFFFIGLNLVLLFTQNILMHFIRQTIMPYLNSGNRMVLILTLKNI